MPRQAARRMGVVGAAFLAAGSAAAFTPRPELEIHIINVQQAASAVVIGPGADGKRILLDAGHRYKEDNNTLPVYLTGIGLLPADGFHYTFTSHLHEDHIEDFKTLFVDPAEPWIVHSQEFPTTCINCYNGSGHSSGIANDYRTSWLTSTGGGNPVAVEVRQPPLGPQQFPIGGGAVIEVLAANGQIAGNTPVTGALDENDRSMVLLISYGSFEFVWGGDANGETSACFDPPGSHKNIEGKVVEAVDPVTGTGLRRLTTEGVDVMHVNHHGSSTSTCAGWVNTMRPEVAIISVGRNTDGNPEPEVVDDMLLAERTDPGCVTVDPALVLQGDEGELTDAASDSGFVVGDIIIRSDGSSFSIEASGRVTYGLDERAAAGVARKRTFLVDDLAPNCPMVKFIPDGALVYQPDQEFKSKHLVSQKGAFTVQAGGEALVEAGTQIVLTEGFTVEVGGEFVAAVRPLSDCS